MSDTFAIMYASARVRPVGVPESRRFEHIRPNEIVRVPTSGDAGVEDLVVCGPVRPLGRDRYEVIGRDKPAVWVKLIRPPASGIVTLHWTSRHKWQEVSS